MLLDGESCLEVVGKISEFDAELADRLRSMVDSFHFREILKALEESTGGRAP